MIIKNDYSDVQVSQNHWKLTFTGTWAKSPQNQTDEEQAKYYGKRQMTAYIQVEMHEYDEPLKYLVSATRLNGNVFAFYKIYEDLY